MLTPVEITALLANWVAEGATVVYLASPCFAALISSSDGDRRSHASAPPATSAPSSPTMKGAVGVRILSAPYVKPARAWGGRVNNKE